MRFGVVQRAHGVRGWLRVRPDQGSDAWPAEAREVRIGGHVHELVQVRTVDSAFLVLLAGMTAPEPANELRSLVLELPAESLSPLAPGEYYFFELKGFAACDEALLPLGTIADVSMLSAQALIVLQTARGEKLVPVHSSIIRRVDRENRRVLLRIPEGLLDI